jgi:hypothetical protein
VLAQLSFDGVHVWHNKSTILQDAQKGQIYHPPTTPAATSPTHPESAKTAFLPGEAPCPKQGRSE